MKTLLGAIYRTEPVSFEIEAPVDVAVERLSRVTVRSVLFTPFQEALVGKVAASGVALRYHRPMLHNTFSPVFVGSFTGDRDRASLEGRFTLPLLAKVFLSVLLALLTAVVVLTVVSSLQSNRPLLDRLVPVFSSLLALVSGVSLANVGWWFGRRDVEYISRRVGEALSSGGS